MLETFVAFGTEVLAAGPIAGPSVPEDDRRSLLQSVGTRPLFAEEGEWTRAASAAGPSARDSPAMAYDDASDRIVLFGGSTAAGRSDETWSYDLNANSWTLMIPATRPSGRRWHAMAHDAQSDGTVLFGGSTALGTSDETWLYTLDTDIWSLATPAVKPSARFFHAMAYDSESDRIVLFGGVGPGGRSNETWSYDLNANTWALTSPATGPSARDSHAMAYDAQSDRIVLFGGTTAVGVSDETWSYDLNGDTWTLMAPETRPYGRRWHAMAYDAQSDAIVLFGGSTAAGANNETWSYDLNANWTFMGPNTKPSARANHAMAYDSESDRVVLFGPSAETWVYDLDSNAWSTRRFAGRRLHSLAYDAESDRLVLFGGTTALGVSDETWSYDLNSNTWALMTPSSRPSARSGHAMAYDALSDRIVLFGGFTGDYNDETWSYDFDADAWTLVNPAAKPSARSGHAMAYDAPSDRIVLFGGSTAAGPSDETWSYGFNDSTWTFMNPAAKPSAHVYHAMAYDAESDRVVLFGGSTAAGPRDETWSYDLNADTWTHMGPATAPSARDSHAMAYDAQSDAIVLFGGLVPGLSDETWSYDLNSNTWALITPSSRPSARSGHAMAYDALSDRIVLFGGSIGGGLSDETWWYVHPFPPAPPPPTPPPGPPPPVAPVPPSPPIGLRVTARVSHVSLKWEAAAWDGGSVITHYRIYRGTLSGSLYLLVMVGNVLEYTDTTLTRGMTYYYQVSAVNGVGEGRRSRQVSVTVLENRAPTAAISAPISGAIVSSAVTIAGEASDRDGNLLRVEVQIDGGSWQAATGARNWTFDLDTTTLPNGPHTIGVQSFDGISYSDVLTITMIVDNPRVPLLLPVAVILVAVAITRLNVVLFGRKSVKTFRARRKARRAGPPQPP